METRNRGRRAVAQPASRSETGRPKRRTRQKTTPGPSPSSSARRESRRSLPPPRTPQETSSFTKGLAANPIPRRGAVLSGRAKSIASIATDPPRPEDDTEDYDYDDDDAMPEPVEDQVSAEGDAEGDAEHVPGEVVDGDQDERVEDQDEATRLEIMALSLPDLAKAADDLVELLTRPDFDFSNKVYGGLLNIKKRALAGIREIYEEDHMAPFIDWLPMLKVYRVEDEAEVATEIVARANIATAFDEVCTIRAGESADHFPLINKLYDVNLDIFFTSSDMRQDPNLLLDIRTQYLIDVLDAQDEAIDPYDFIAEVFCEPSEADHVRRFVDGPFKRLAIGKQGDDNDEMCSSRIIEIVQVVKPHKKGWKNGEYGVEDLQERFPLDRLLENLQSWLLDTHAALTEAEKIARSRADGHHRALPSIAEEDDVVESQTNVVESQPIIRAGTGEGPSLFHDETSLRYLQGQRFETPIGPPSNQQQALPPPGAPMDYPEHTNEELLADTPQPQSSAPGRSQSWLIQGSKSHKRQAEDEAEDDDDVFEIDTRIVRKGKGDAISSARPAAKRPRLVPPPPPPSSRPPRPRGSFPSSAPASAQHENGTSHDDDTAPPPSAPQSTSLNNLKSAKQDIAHRARLATSGFKQRFAWSDHDTNLLLRLIHDRHAAWAVIEKHDNVLFEHPRNQQAYRDKARNMKVDYLMTDAVLPPCFDLVALGKKEITRLTGLGKNPYRKEADVDDDGNAVGTEYGG